MQTDLGNHLTLDRIFNVGAASEIQGRLDFAVEAARAAGEITLRYFRRADLAVERKADASPVTLADREAEAYLREAIHKRFPQDGIVGEEWGTDEGSSGFRWIIDPIDGTKSFIHGVPLYATLIGVEWEGRAVIGVDRIPATGEVIFAAKGRGAWYQIGEDPPQPARVSRCENLAEAAWVTSEVLNFDKINRREAFHRLQSATRLFRTWGDGYGYLLVGTGRIDFMIDPLMEIWDAAAIQPIIEEAGGIFTDWRGQPVFTSGNGIGSNGLLHNQVLDVLRGTD